MTIQLPPELEAFVEAQVKAGHFPSPDELKATALTQLRDGNADVDALDEAALDEAEIEIDAGLDRPWDEVELRRKYLDG